MNTKHILATGVAALVWAHNAAAMPPLALSAKGGTLGYGVEATCGLGSKLNLRVGFNPGPTYHYSFRADEVDYEVGLRFKSLSTMLDWHPATGPFHLSSGLFVNDTKLSGEAAPSGAYVINGTEYSADDVGTLRAAIAFSGLAPYFGLGWGNAVGDGNRIGFVFDIGVLVQGAPKVDMSASGPLANDPLLQQDLANEQAALADGVRTLRLYPMASLALRYRL